MDKVANLPVEDRNILFSETASRMHTTNAIVEKDFWVVWTLDKLFSDIRLNKILMFKGGTSLSKVFELIGRFSEDIDLILDWELLTGENPYADRTKNKQNKFNEHINEDAKKYIADKLLPIVSEILEPYCICMIDEKDGFSINIQYPSLFTDPALRPQILLEIGPLASWSPFSNYEISSFVAQKFPEYFENPTCKVATIVAERTFWEKATILHQEANRTEEKKIPLRHSRHYYDLAMMATSSVKDKALLNLELLEGVVAFKQRFYSSAWAKYEDAKIGTLKLLPPEFRYKELKADYVSMRNMIFDKYIEFDEVMSILKDLEDEINFMEESNLNEK